DTEKIKNVISETLTAKGFFEIMNNSLSAEVYYKNLTTYPLKKLVYIKNPLSNELNILRQTLLFGFLQTIQLNLNRKQKDIRLFEFGNIYQYNNRGEQPDTKDFTEEIRLGVSLTGQYGEAIWNAPVKEYDFFRLKAIVGELLTRLGLSEYNVQTSIPEDIFFYGLTYYLHNKAIVSLGAIKKIILQKFEIKKTVYYAEFNWSAIFQLLKDKQIEFKPLRKFPEVQRDISLLINRDISYNKIHTIIENTNKRLIKRILLFDVFENEQLGKDKKSYAVRIIFQDEKKTLNEKEINKLMNQLIRSLEEKLGATIR
ncbi:MAG TPA: phenylalanine--tRNA ligase subunit beta, partial [Bacteroidales bacterium]|nr:phenylalanine--tRNA ligase subunit beta [Bacteroidales bacterium]